MSDLKFEQKSSLSRTEAADQLESLARALRAGEDAELRWGPGVLSLKIPDTLRAEVEFEVEDGEIELEIELKWRMDDEAKASGTKAPAPKKAEVKKAETRKPAPKKPEAKKPAPKKPAPKPAPKKPTAKKATAKKAKAAPPASPARGRKSASPAKSG
ncbi:amphi-Trp domain-containing protein [Streptomyces tanashiensis]|uniref:amphi-Trp domain-containing protein n=1 Tax=Streptomyces tanashiensis TaxID=67367 RepID=UPI0036E427EE